MKSYVKRKKMKKLREKKRKRQERDTNWVMSGDGIGMKGKRRERQAHRGKREG